MSKLNVTELAHAVMKSMGRDEAGKQLILARSPHLAHGMDAEELASMSSRELAERELKELGLDVLLGPDADPEVMLKMYHAGRMNPQLRPEFASMGSPYRHRDVGNGIPGGGGLLGGAHDVFEGAAVDKWLADLEGRHSAQDSASTGLPSLDAYLNSKD